MGQIFRPVSLMASEDLDSRKVGEIFMVSDNIYREMQTLQVVLPNLECLKDRKEFFVVNVIVKFQCRKGVGVKCDGIDIGIYRIDKKDSPKCIVRSVSLNNNLGIQYLVCKYWCRCESLFKSCKC